MTCGAAPEAEDRLAAPLHLTLWHELIQKPEGLVDFRYLHNRATNTPADPPAGVAEQRLQSPEQTQRCLATYGPFVQHDLEGYCPIRRDRGR